MTDTLAHISEKPWSEYTKMDYTPEQWHKACLIHQHQGAPTSKDQCKLPVRTPNGALNRNGVHAAAAALAGARGGVHASAEEMSSARTALTRLYGELDEKPPPSLLAHSGIDFLEHYGIRGMRWGIRRDRGSSGGPPENTYAKQVPGQPIRTSGGRNLPAHEDAVRTALSKQKAKSSTTNSLSTKELQDLVQRMNLEQQYSKLVGGSETSNAKGKKALQVGTKFIGSVLGNVGKQVATEVTKQHAMAYAVKAGLALKK